jgi:hypothetical protein
MSRTPARTTRRHLLAAAALTLTAGLPTTADTEADAPMKHIVLLGDSVFDNAVYVAGGPDVIEQVRERLPAGWRATLRAVDGSVIGSVERQLHLLPPKPSHLVISVGGNDALRHAGVLDETTCSMADALDRLAGIRDQFAQEYAAMLNGVLGRGLVETVDDNQQLGRAAWLTIAQPEVQAPAPKLLRPDPRSPGEHRAQQALRVAGINVAGGDDKGQW